MRRVILVLFHVLFLTVPLFFSSKTDELFEFNKIILTYLLTVLILATWFARMVVEKKMVWKKTPFDLPIALFLASQFISLLLSMHMRTSWFGYYSRFHGGVLSLLTYVALYYAFVNNVQRQDIRPLVRTVLYGGLVTALYAIPEHFGHSPSCLLMFNQFNVDCWIQDVKNRVFGTFGQPNWLAAYLVMLIPLGISMMLEKKRSIPALAPYFGLTGIFFMTLLFTNSRSGALALGLAAIVFVGLLMMYATRLKHTVSLRQSAVPLGITGAVFLMLFFAYGQTYISTLQSSLQKAGTSAVEQVERATSSANPDAVTQESPEPESVVVGTQLDSGGTESSEIREVVWRGALNVWRMSPKTFLVGTGVETFAYSYYRGRPVEHNLLSEWDFLYNKAHNEYLNFLATTGVLGLGTYLLMIAWVTVWAVRQPFDKREHGTYASANVLAVVGWISGYLGLQLSNVLGFSTVMVSILMYLVPAFLLVQLDPPAAEKVRSPAKLDGGQIFALLLISGTSLYLLLAVTRWWRADAAYATAKQLVNLRDGLGSVQSLERAIALSPNEAVFHDEYASTLSSLALGLASQNDATRAGLVAQRAIQESDRALELNPVHLNFYKTRARVMITLSALYPELLTEAEQTFLAAQQLAPTDPKPVYNRAIILLEQGQTDQAKELLETVLEMKPNYVQAQDRLRELEAE